MKNFKDSGIEWLGEIPEHWEVVPIRCCFGEFNIRCNDNDYPLLSVTIANGVVYQNDITDKKDISNDDKSNYKIVPLGAIAYNKMRMWQGAVGINMLEKGIVSPAYVVAIPNKQINISFSYYLLKSRNIIGEYEKNSYGLCSDMNNLRYEDFQNIKIPLPPLKEQEQIVNFLDEKCEQITNFIEKKEKLISLLKEQKQALINETITKGLNKNVNFKDSGIEWLGEIPQHWKILKLKHIASLRNQKSNNIDFRIGLENIESKTGKFIPSSEIVFEEDGIGFEKGDILFGKLRPYLAKVFLTDRDGICVSEFLVLKIKSESNKFIKFLMLSSLFIDIVDSSTYGTKMPRANWEFIGNLKIPLPPLKEQEQIANFLDKKCEKIDLLIEKTKKQIKLIKEYKTTLINQAVCGRMDL
ncbi:TPA: restriction endonuclease subunit S [Campylobacter jejuni]|nr:restriction endonuclease subunit S [Campylobacter jejuni]HDZ5105165.1 restriction endonuclease subunit S [Campylobacter jejuni]HDZ5107427.1 restriction endonuclease subunit S [Campylobacter jejuni]